MLAGTCLQYGSEAMLARTCLQYGFVHKLKGPEAKSSLKPETPASKGGDCWLTLITGLAGEEVFTLTGHGGGGTYTSLWGHLQRCAAGRDTKCKDRLEVQPSDAELNARETCLRRIHRALDASKIPLQCCLLSLRNVTVMVMPWRQTRSHTYTPCTGDTF
eukprot:1155026-Pelagomonas_calceolata.AAC.2